MLRRRLAAVVGSAVLISAPLALAGASSASADEVWFQSIGRASADAKCAPSSAEDLEAGWTEWAPSWAEWANNGSGGWTCDRQITWALSGGWSPVCASYLSGVESILFTDGPAWPTGSLKYSGADCSVPASSPTNVNGVYAPEGQAQAEALCREEFGLNNVLTNLTTPSAGDTAWFCQ